MLNLNEIICDYQVIIHETWQGASRTAARLLEQIPELVAELREAREKAEYLTTQRDLARAGRAQMIKAKAEVERLRALMPSLAIAYSALEWHAIGDPAGQAVEAMEEMDALLSHETLECICQLQKAKEVNGE